MSVGDKSAAVRGDAATPVCGRVFSDHAPRRGIATRAAGPGILPSMENMPHGSVCDLAGATGRRMRLRWVGRCAAFALALLGLCAAAGCDSPLARQRTADRERSLKWTVGTLAERERKSPERLQHDFEYIKREESKREQLFARDLAQAKAYIDFDIRRWQERQDDYAKEIWEQLRGKPENLERNAIILFY